MDPISNPNPTANPMPNPGTEPVVPEAPAGAGMPVAGTPVAGVVNPVANPGVINPAAQAAPLTSPVINPTTPLTMPDKPAEPDPVEEELKAPLKAVGPVPGSIGSAISMSENGVPVNQAGEPIENPSPNAMPTAGAPVAGVSNTAMPNMGGVPNAGMVGAAVPSAGFGAMPGVPGATGQTPNVAFNDPAMQTNPNPMMANTPMANPAKKKFGFGTQIKMNKTTLILLCVLAGIVVVALIAILISQLSS